MKSRIIAAAFFFGSSMVFANTNPTSLFMTVYELRVSENSDCSAAVTVFNDSAAQPVDFVANGTLGSGAIPNKTYHCIMFHLSDNISVVPEASVAPGCTAGDTYTQDIFNDPGQDVSVDPDGTTITGNMGTDEKPWAYFSDSSDADPAGNCWQASKTSSGGPCLLTAINVTGDLSRSLIFNFDNKIGNANGSCGANAAPSVSIR